MDVKCPHDRRLRECGVCNGVSVYKRHLRNVVARGLTNELTEARYRWLIQLPCTYCGAERGGGVDRVKSEYGYTTLNSVSCCFRCNQMKSARSAPVFLAAAAAVVAHSGTYEHFKNRWIETRTTGPDLPCARYISTAAATASTPPSCLSEWEPQSTAHTAAASSINKSPARRRSRSASMERPEDANAQRREANDSPRSSEPELAARTAK